MKYFLLNHYITKPQFVINYNVNSLKMCLKISNSNNKRQNKLANLKSIFPLLHEIYWLQAYVLLHV